MERRRSRCVRCRGVPLLVRVLRTLQSVGIREAVIITGHDGERIRRALLVEPSLGLELSFVHNPRYQLKNGVSLLSAAPFVDRECLLTMSDHLYSPELVRQLLAYELAPECLRPRRRFRRRALLRHRRRDQGARRRSRIGDIAQGSRLVRRHRYGRVPHRSRADPRARASSRPAKATARSATACARWRLAGNFTRWTSGTRAGSTSIPPPLSSAPKR